MTVNSDTPNLDAPKKKKRGTPRPNLKTDRAPGRPKGALSKETIRKAKLAAKGVRKALKTGITPLEVMVKRMIDPSSVSDASFQAAVAAAQYMHPRLAAVAVKDVSDKGPPLDLSKLTAEQLSILRQIVRIQNAGASKTTPAAISGPVIDAVEDGDDE